jgi:hypothetical protein
MFCSIGGGAICRRRNTSARNFCTSSGVPEEDCSARFFFCQQGKHVFFHGSSWWYRLPQVGQMARVIAHPLSFQRKIVFLLSRDSRNVPKTGTPNLSRDSRAPYKRAGTKREEKRENDDDG